MVEDDLVVLERWRGGDQKAGQELLQRHFQSVYRFFDHKCRGDVDDLVQRTFYQCVRSRDQFRGASTFRTYLFSIARHELYQHLRDLRRDARLDFHVTSLQEIITTVGSRLARLQDVERLKAAMRVLPLEQQLLLEMHYWHDLDSTQLGEVFELPPATVRTKLFRARQALKRELEEPASRAQG